MKERPILFSGEMVKAILSNRKTQTRRVMKPQPHWDECVNGVNYCGPMAFPVINPVGHQCGHPIFIDGRKPEATLCRNPYGVPGDRLWVREAYYAWGKWVRNGTTKSGRQAWKFVQVGTSIRYMDGNKPTATAKRDGECGWVYRHSRFMPRKHSRIMLEITEEVRVQRLQDISEEDALAEGIWPPCPASFHEDQCIDPENIRFLVLWDSINAKRGFVSHPNPFVWVITFKRVEA